MHFSQESLDIIQQEIQKRHRGGYRALQSCIVDQLRAFREANNFSSKFVVGISGGIDSTVVAKLATRAVGKNNVIALYLPASKKDEGMEFFGTVKRYLGTTPCHNISIQSLVRSAARTIQRVSGNLDKMTRGNIAARLRVNFFYAFAREKGAFVLGTGNRTEIVQGYATKFGTPMSCDFGVLDELYKTDVYALARQLRVPAPIVNRTPTTGFFEGQSHEEELGATMLEQDAAAYLLFERKMHVHHIVKSYDVSAPYLEAFLERHRTSRHKRILFGEHVTLGYIDDDVS